MMTATGGKVRANKSLGKLVKLLGSEQKIVTPRYTQFLLDHPNGITYDQWVIDRVMAELNKPPRNRVGTFSASSAGDCARHQVLSFLGVPGKMRTDVQLENMGNDGTWRHRRWQANCLQAGIIEDIEFALPWPKYRSMGSTDGIGYVPDDHPIVRWRGKPFILELKGAFSFKAMNVNVNGPEVFEDQIMRYMLVSGIDLVSLVVENRDSMEFVEYIYEADKDKLRKSRHDLIALNHSVDTKTLPPRLTDCERRVGQTYKTCPFGGRADSPCTAIDRWPGKSLITAK